MGSFYDTDPDECCGRRKDMKLEEVKNRAIKALEQEPCEDTIGRQAAIDATWLEPSYTDPLNVLTEARDRLKALPSAQPEITRCKDCGHFHYDMPCVVQGVPVLGHEVCDFWGFGCKTSENGYCSFAERREDERSES